MTPPNSSPIITRPPLLSRKTQRGATLVEYAFVMLLSLTLLFGISGFGHFLYVYHAINNAAKEGSRWASVNGSLCNNDLSCNGSAGMNNGPASRADIVAYVKARMPASVVASLSTVSADFSAEAGALPVCSGPMTGVDGVVVPKTENYPSCTVTVTVSYPYNFSFPLLPSVTTTTPPCASAGWCISTTSKMVIVH
jgi:Flp pilus assembly protein TadG